MKLNYGTLVFLVVFVLIFAFVAWEQPWTAPHIAGVAIIMPSFVLFVLANKPMCGYDVIKEIFSRCNVFLSQGNVYPILYSLEEEGILRAEFTKGNMRSKLYFIAPEQRETIQKKIDLFVKAMESMLFFVKR